MAFDSTSLLLPRAVELNPCGVPDYLPVLPVFLDTPTVVAEGRGVTGTRGGIAGPDLEDDVRINQ